MGDCNVCNRCPWYEPDAPGGPCVATPHDHCDVDELQERVSNLSALVDVVQAEKDDMRRCGNCRHLFCRMFCDAEWVHPQPHTLVQHYDRCHLTPSRWELCT